MAATARMLVVMAVLALFAESPAARAQIVYGPPPQGGIVVPYEPTPDNVVDAMLSIGQVTAQDFVMDLGSGDGRIVITAAKKYGARGLGIELNPDLVKRSIENAAAAGVSDRATFQQQDIFKVDLSQASVITMFLFPKINIQLRPKLLDLKPGTRIVSHFHDMADWRPDQQQHLMTKEHYGDTWIFLWYIPAKVEGEWRWTEQRSGPEQRHRLTLHQTYQEVSGTLTTDSLRPIDIRDGKLRGAQLTFWVPIREGGRTARWDFRGEVDGGVITGTERSGSASGVTDRTWHATRQ